MGWVKVKTASKSITVEKEEEGGLPQKEEGFPLAVLGIGAGMATLALLKKKGGRE